MKYLKRFLLTIFAIVLLLSAGFVIWALNAAPPGQAALAALVSDQQVTVTQTAEYIAFQPSARQPSIGLIFYPGGRVDYRAYAPVLHQIAAQGYLVILVPVNLNLAFFEIEAGAPALKDFPEIQTWAVSGHSLGGVAASIFAANHPEIRGIVYWASYPADDTLKNTGLKTLSIYGTLDGLATLETVEKNKAFMPGDTIFIPIEGGNHAQFADYGFQPGDNLATISPEAQWQQAARAVSDFLQSLNR